MMHFSKTFSTPITVAIPVWGIGCCHRYYSWSRCICVKDPARRNSAGLFLLLFVISWTTWRGWQGPNPASYWAPWNPIKVRAFSFLKDCNFIWCRLWCCFGNRNKAIFKGRCVVSFYKAVLPQWISLKSVLLPANPGDLFLSPLVFLLWFFFNNVFSFMASPSSLALQPFPTWVGLFISFLAGDRLLAVVTMGVLRSLSLEVLIQNQIG